MNGTKRTLAHCYMDLRHVCYRRSAWLLKQVVHVAKNVMKTILELCISEHIGDREKTVIFVFSEAPRVHCMAFM